ncbi:MAG: molecular chaperone GrpE [Candidatus Saccharimonadales bacterium]|jgi:molecular chaperone GrpE
MAKKENKKTAKVDYKKVAEELAADNALLNDSLLRERADAMNVRKRAEDERVKMAGYHKAAVVKELLPTIDNFERSLASVPEGMEDNEYVKGVQGVVKQFGQTLEKLGVERIKTVGEPFDPEVHNAVTMEEGDSDEEVVSEELQSGYKMQKEVIRHAMVRVKG